jgi:hypothetical protein
VNTVVSSSSFVELYTAMLKVCMKAGRIFHAIFVESAFLRKWLGITMFVYIQVNVHFVVKFVGSASKQNLLFTSTRNFIVKSLLHHVPLVRNHSDFNPVCPFTCDPIQVRGHTPVTFVIKDSPPIEIC